MIEIKDSKFLLTSLRVSVLQVSQLEQELERERTSSLHELRRKQAEVEEAKQEVQRKEKQAAELSASIM